VETEHSEFEEFVQISRCSKSVAAEKVVLIVRKDSEQDLKLGCYLLEMRYDGAAFSARTFEPCHCYHCLNIWVQVYQNLGLHLRLPEAN
jgi:hypothetical protein